MAPVNVYHIARLIHLVECSVRFAEACLPATINAKLQIRNCRSLQDSELPVRIQRAQRYTEDTRIGLFSDMPSKP